MLHPCSSCRRHVALTETACPFCGAPLAARPAGTLVAGRWSRAAVFAGAALTGCYTGSPPPRYEPPPAPGPQQQAVAPPDAGPTPTTTFATPPPPPTPPPPHTAHTLLRGRVLDRRTGGPLAGAVLEARGPDHKLTRTDSHGEFVFQGLAPGAYHVTLRRPASARILGANHAIQLADGVPQQLNLVVDVQPRVDPDLDRERHYQNHPCDNGVCAPYGAPPARRRLV